MAGVSVLVLTYNEEANMRPCLESVRWSDDVHVVDSGSTDRTVDICREFDLHLHHHAFESYSAQNNWALENLPFRHAWLLVVDADEMVPDALRAEILEAVRQAPEDIDGFYVRWRIYFLGGWIKYSTLYHSTWLLRLFRHRKVRYEDRPINPHPVLHGKYGRLRNDLLHDNRNGLTRLIAKYNSYTTMEAQETLRLRRGEADTGLTPRFFGTPTERRRWFKQLFMRLLFRPLIKFAYLYFLRGGILDGVPGFHFCVLQSINEYHIGLKARELGQGQQGTPGQPRA